MECSEHKTHTKHTSVFAHPECTLTQMYTATGFLMEKHISLPKPFSLSDCSPIIINLYLTVAQLYEKDFLAVRTFFALSTFAEKALYLLC